MAKKVVVVRVGSKTTHIVHMENAISNPTIYGCVRVPTPDNAFDDGMLLDIVEISKRIKKVCQDKGIHTKDAIFTIASSRVASRETTIPVVNKSKVSQLVMSQVTDLFPVDSESYLFSYLLQGGPRQGEDSAQVQDVRVFAVPAEMVDGYYALAEAAGFHIVAVDADHNSIFEIMRRQVYRGGVIMAIQLNRASTLINVMSDERLLMQRSVPYGVNGFAEAMLQEPAFQLTSLDDAYRVLTTQRVLLTRLNAENPHGDISREKRAEVTNSGEYLISNIARVVEYYTSKNEGKPIEEIVCCGIGCTVPGIHELIQNELGITVKKPETLDGIRFNRKVTIDSALLQYINCFGSVFKPVRFMPRDIAKKEEKKGALTGALLIFFALFLLSGALAAWSFISVMTATEERDLTRARYETLTPVQSEFNQQTQIIANYGLYKAVKVAIDTHGNHFHDLIDKISDVCPKSFKIQSISADEQKVTISAVSVDRLSSVSKLQMQLNNIEQITNVKINQISESKEALTKKKQYVYTMEFTYAVIGQTEEEVQ